MNRCSAAARRRIEQELDMVLRPVPAATDGTIACRVYSPEINTQSKLRELISARIGEDVTEGPLQPSTLQRMVNDYLTSRGCRLSFTESDHNACPNYQTLQLALLSFDAERKMLDAELKRLWDCPAPTLTALPRVFSALERISRTTKIKKQSH